MSKLAKALTAAAGNAGGESIYVDDVFSSYLYDGNSSTQTITNGIDLSGEGGLVWLKQRNVGNSHVLVDTERGASNAHFSDLTLAQQTIYPYISSFNSNGFTLGNMNATNATGATHVSWTFRKQAGFFDVVTYTGNGTAGRTVSHSLGSAPGCIIVKRTDSANGWAVYHRAMDSTAPEDWMMRLNAADARFDLTPSRWNDTAPTSTEFTLSDNDEVNGSGATYVAYLFAHDDQSFGDNSNESIIKCGSFTETGSDVSVNLGFEPQWLMLKRSDGVSHWFMYDTMRGLTWSDGSNAYLQANTSNAEDTQNAYFKPTPTGFIAESYLGSGATWVYIAIRRPMKTPEAGTEVFAPVAYTGDGSNDRRINTNIVPDMVLWKSRSNGTDWKSASMLAGKSRALTPNTTGSEGSVPGYYITDHDNEGFNFGTSDSSYNTNTWTYVTHAFKRATGFFDVVAYTGDGTSSRSLNHNLGVAPELMIIKQRSATRSWAVYSSATGTGKFLKLEDTAGVVTQSGIFDTAPTSSVFTVGSNTYVNISGGTYIAYLFATLAGISKVGSYTGTGNSLDINCGFSSGARFVLIKRTDSTSDWWVWDSARGIVAGNDPTLRLNSTAAETTTADYIDPLSSGFTLTTAGNWLYGMNYPSGEYIFLAIA